MKISLTVKPVITATMILMFSVAAQTQANTEKTYCTQETQPFTYTMCAIPNLSKKTSGNDMKLKLHWWNKKSQKPLYTFSNLKTHINQNGKTLRFAMNAGMYDVKYAPLALYVENGKKYKTLNQKQGGGNFHLLPNGVFWIDKRGASHVTETRQYATIKGLKTKHQPAYATQSGPMLVINGKLHPKFKKDSVSRKIRNGVGICKGENGKETVNFVISDTWVNFYDFASLFKDKLNCKNALFLDGGRASALYSDDVSRHDKKYMGVMIGYEE